MELTKDEGILLMLYFTDTRIATIATIREMQTFLTAEEKYLNGVAEELCRKLTGITDEEFLLLPVVQEYIG